MSLVEDQHFRALKMQIENGLCFQFFQILQAKHLSCIEGQT